MEQLVTKRTFAYEPKVVDKIIVRDFAFEFPKDLDPVWCPQNPVRSHLFNGLSLVKPYLEPYMVRSTQAALPYIDAPELIEDMRGFNGQEARHYQCHRQLNELLKSNGYPELANVEKRLAKSYKRLLTKSLRTQLAYNAGFECMTNGFTNWMINKRTKLFLGASPQVTSFLLMHAVEETEHKTVAYDVYMAYSGQYLPRAIGVFHGSLHVLGYMLIGMVTALRKDKIFRRPRGVVTFIREVASLIGNVGPYLLRALLPWHNPRCDDDPKWMTDWIRGHAALAEGEKLPLVDTDNPAMPVPFAMHDDRKDDRRRIIRPILFPERRIGERRGQAIPQMA
jgi:predicted metal-dependent hydrolase